MCCQALHPSKLEVNLCQLRENSSRPTCSRQLKTQAASDSTRTHYKPQPQNRHSLQHSSEQSAAAAAEGLALCPLCHPAYAKEGTLVVSPQGHPRHTSAQTVGRPGVARNSQTSPVTHIMRAGPTEQDTRRNISSSFFHVFFFLCFFAFFFIYFFLFLCSFRVFSWVHGWSKAKREQTKPAHCVTTRRNASLDPKAQTPKLRQNRRRPNGQVKAEAETQRVERQKLTSLGRG